MYFLLGFFFMIEEEQLQKIQTTAKFQNCII